MMFNKLTNEFRELRRKQSSLGEYRESSPSILAKPVTQMRVHLKNSFVETEVAKHMYDLREQRSSITHLENKLDQCFSKVDYAEEWIERTQQRFTNMLIPINQSIEVLQSQMSTVLSEIPALEDN